MSAEMQLVGSIGAEIEIGKAYKTVVIFVVQLIEGCYVLGRHLWGVLTYFSQK
jgi:hypothetical protein